MDNDCPAFKTRIKEAVYIPIVYRHGESKLLLFPYKILKLRSVVHLKLQKKKTSTILYNQCACFQI